MGGQAEGHFPCRLLDSGFWYPLPFQGQCSDIEGRLQGLFIFPGCLLEWEWEWQGEGSILVGGGKGLLLLVAVHSLHPSVQTN